MGLGKKKTKFKKLNKQWDKLYSRMALVLTLAALVAGVSSYLAPLVFAGGNTTQVTATLTAAGSCTFTANVATIPFGTVPDGTNTIGTTIPVNIVNTGVTPTNILLSGSNWNWVTPGGASVTNTVYSNQLSNSLWSPQPSRVAPTTGTANVEVTLTGSQVDTLNPVTNSIGPANEVFGVNVPTSVPSGSYQQTVNIISSC